MSRHAVYEVLARIEQAARSQGEGNHYLWPRTPVGGDYQPIIGRRVGASDYDYADPRSRPNSIASYLGRLCRQGLLPPGFVLLDIACGDAVVLTQLKRQFPTAAMLGLDCNKGMFPYHETALQQGVELYDGFLQQLFAERLATPIDVAVMLNTFRSWEAADLSPAEADLPARAEQWILDQARLAIVTASQTQVARLQAAGLHVQVIGRGEDEAIMVALSRAPLPATSHYRWACWYDRVARRWWALAGRLRNWGRHLRFSLATLPGALLGGRLPARTCGHYYAQWLGRDLREDCRGRSYAGFCFLGEFGYELLNWQGVVRKFQRQAPPGLRVIVAARPGLQVLYPGAEFCDITQFEPYQQSVAMGYYGLPAHLSSREIPPTLAELRGDQELRDGIAGFVCQRLGLDRTAGTFVFSSFSTRLGDCVFGANRLTYGPRSQRGKIYGDRFILTNNLYERLVPPPAAVASLEQRLAAAGLAPGAFILVQCRRRRIGPQFGGKLPETELLAALAQRLPVVLLSFATGRNKDSGSAQEAPAANVTPLAVADLGEQGALISLARVCVFLTEGDFGSHLYLPPLFGKDCVAVAAADILKQPSAAYRFWNAEIFRFGGQIRPVPYNTGPGGLADCTRQLGSLLDELGAAAANN